MTLNDRLFFRISKALADPRRFAILLTITRTPNISCSNLTAQFPIGQPTVSHHLKILENAELIRMQRQGQFALFSLNRDTFNAYIRELQSRVLGPQSGED